MVEEVLRHWCWCWCILCIISFMTLHAFFHVFDFRLIDSNNFCRFYIFLPSKKFHYLEVFRIISAFFGGFLIPCVIQRVKCFFCFNLILATGKHSSYSESIMLLLKKLMYASLEFLHCLTLLQFILHNLNWSENLRFYTNSFLASFFSAICL